MSDYTLSDKIFPYLDRHMVLSHVEFIEERKLYDPTSLLTSKYQLTSQTRMINFTAQIYEKLYGKELPDLEKKRDDVFKEIKDARDKCLRLLKVVYPKDAELSEQEQEQALQQLQKLKDSNQFTMMYLKEINNTLQDADIDSLYQYAQIQYECGDYELASELFKIVYQLSRDDDKRFNALWNKLAAEILIVNTESASADLSELQSLIDQRTSVPHLEQLEQRTWLLHWCLFIFFNPPEEPSKPSPRNIMIDFMLNEKMLNAIQINCPHLLRYLTAAVILKRRKSLYYDVVKVLQNEKNYSDPITQFLVSLTHEYDFDRAHASLNEARKLLVNDFYLYADAQEFMDAARLLMFETYCRIHKCISIDVLIEKLDIKRDEAEKKLVEYMKSARVDAKIDLKSNQLIMNTEYLTVYQQVIDKTKFLAYRLPQLAGMIDKRPKE